MPALMSPHVYVAPSPFSFMSLLQCHLLRETIPDPHIQSSTLILALSRLLHAGTLSTALITINMLCDYLLSCWASLQKSSSLGTGTLLYSLLYPQSPEQYLAYSRCSITSQVNEEVNEGMNTEEQGMAEGNR